jgi:hypothetical protein
MPKAWRVVVLSAGVVVVAAWILWWASAGYPLDGPICLDGSSIKDDCPRYNVALYSAWRFAEFASHWAALIAALSVVVLAIFTVRLWLSTDRLWSVTHKALERAERSAKKEMRAYLSVEPLGINEYVGQNCLLGYFQIRNTGKIPANNVSIYSTIQLDADGARKHFPIGAPRLSPTVLQPGATMEFASFDAWQIPADQLDRNDPLKIHGYIYVWGEVLYTDTFDTVGWTAFCHRYPCDMFGMAARNEATNERARYRNIDAKFARYHEEAGNEAG